MVVGDTVRERVVAQFFKYQESMIRFMDTCPLQALLERPELFAQVSLDVSPLFLRQLQFVHIVFHVRLEIGGHAFAQLGSGIAHVLPEAAGIG